MGVPEPEVDRRYGVTVIGAPFDCGPSRYRFGPHLAPPAIRAASQRLLRSKIDSDRDVLAELSVRDAGDAEVALDDPDGSLVAIQAAVSQVLNGGGVPLILGGDGSIALAVMRALAENLDGCAVLHFDAHTDCNLPQDGHNHAATAFSRAHQEQLIGVDASMHIGLRGPTLMPNSARLARDLGYRTISSDDLLDRGITGTLDQLHEVVGDRPVYVCWDMDVFDPSVAPGVFSPSWGGLTAAQGLRLIRGLAGLRIVAADINTVSPPHDIDDLTASLAAQLAFELMHALPEK